MALLSMNGWILGLNRIKLNAKIYSCPEWSDINDIIPNYITLCRITAYKNDSSNLRQGWKIPNRGGV